MTKRVLLVGSIEHDTTLALVRHAMLRSGGQPVVLDTLGLGASAHVSFSAGPRSSGESTLTSEGSDTPFVEFSSVWLRRWHDPRVLRCLDESDGEMTFAKENWIRLVEGAWLSFGARLVNPPVEHRRASNKVLQLRVAHGMGARIPETLITSDAVQAKRFIDERPGRVICKSVGSTFGSKATRTVLLKSGDIAKLEALRLSPCIFQEYIECDQDIRVVVIGNQTFAFEVDTRMGLDPVDWRMDHDNKWSLHSPPDSILAFSVEIVTRLGLSFGVLDLRLTPEGEYVFFEVNPGGQFLFLEVWTGAPLVDALVSHLLQ